MRRVEDPRFLTGKGRFIDDIQLPGMLYLGVIRSQYARAKFYVKSSDKVITQEDVMEITNPLPNFFAPKAPKEYPLAYKEAKYVGEPLALIVAKDRYEIEDLIDETYVEYEPLPPIVDPLKAMEDKELIHGDFGTNIAYDDTFVYGEEPSDYEYLEKTFRINRICPSPIEPNGVIADYSYAENSLTVYANTQVPQVFRTALSIVFNIPRSKIRIIVPDSGGGFGGKIFLKPLVLASLASIVTKRPVKYIETRTENIMTVQGPDRIYKARILYKGDKLLGMDVFQIEDFGAYLHTYQPLPILRQIYHLTGAYDMKFLRFKIKGVLTNKPPTGPYRGLGIPPAVLVLENLVSSVARKLGIGQDEIRYKNFIKSTPFTTITGAIYDSGDYVKSLSILMREIKREGRGLGIAFALEPGSSLAFQTLVGKSRTPYYEGAYVKMDSGGEVTVTVSSNSMGTGHETSIVQVVSEVLGIPPESVRVVMGDTDGPPGTGFYGSRFSVVTISAVYGALQKLKEKIRELTAKAFNVEKDQVSIEKGIVKVNGKQYKIGEIANIIYNRAILDGDIGLEASFVLKSPNLNVADEKRRVNFSSTYGINAHAVRIKVEETGEVKILDYVILSDCGNMINPMIVDGQIMGGTIMGFGASLMEVVKYDENGNPLQINFSDYLIPSTLEVPKLKIIHTITPSPLTPLGTKGVAEGGATVPMAAIVNAIEDYFNINLDYIEIPITPEFIQGLMEKIHH